jgi:hypothetical protein
MRLDRHRRRPDHGPRPAAPGQAAASPRRRPSRPARPRTPRPGSRRGTRRPASAHRPRRADRKRHQRLRPPAAHAVRQSHRRHRRPIWAANITIIDAHGHQLMRTSTDRSGRYAVDSLPGGHPHRPAVPTAGCPSRPASCSPATSPPARTSSYPTQCKRSSRKASNACRPLRTPTGGILPPSIEVDGARNEPGRTSYTGVSASRAGRCPAQLDVAAMKDSSGDPDRLAAKVMA